MNRSCHPYSKRSAFTLVEVLVVMGIIAVLMSVLLPAISRAQRQSRGLTCLSNLRQLHLWTVAYANENRGRLLGNPDQALVPSWIDSLRLKSESLKGVQYCPSTSGTAGPEQRARFLRPGEGDANLSWSGDWEAWVDDFSGGYGWNSGASNRMITAIAAPARTPLFADCARPAAVPVHPTLQSTYPVQSYTPDEQAYLLHEGYLIDRHQKAINVVFADGHAESVKLDQLMKLSWWPEFAAEELPQ